MASDTNITEFRPGCVVDYVYANVNIANDQLTTFGCSSMTTLEIILTIISLTLIILITIIGNFLVVLSVITYKPLKSVQNYFIASLAIADLTVAFLVMPFNVAYITVGRWFFGSIWCQVWLTCDILCCTASILNLTAIALDRYWAITDPIGYATKRTLKRVMIMISIVWISSTVICVCPLFGWNDWPPEFTIEHPCKLTEKQSFVLFSSMGSFFIPSVIILIVYIKIFSAIRRRTRKRAKQSKINQMNKLAGRPDDSVFSDNGQNHMTENGNQKAVTTPCDKNQCLKVPNSTAADHCRSLGPGRQSGSVSDNEAIAEQEPLSPKTMHPDLKTIDVIVQVAPGGINQIKEFVEERQKISLSKERKAATTLGIIVTVFMVCWLPFFLMYVILPFCPTCTISERVVNFIVWLGYVNSALNPVIYTIFNIEFRRAFAKLLGCKNVDL